MSLLNDALRAAEQRQNRPNVAAAYTGQSTAIRKQRRWLMPVMALLLAVVIAGAVYGFLLRDEGPAPVAVKAAPTPTATVAEAQPAPPETVTQAIEPLPETADDQSAASTNVQVEQSTATGKVSEATETVTAAPQVNTGVEEPQELKEPEPTDQADQSVQVKGEAPEAGAAPQTAAANTTVKQVRETPEAVDLRVSRELSRLLRTGDSRAAEQRLADLTSRQGAPVSREVFARAMLVQDMPERALPWLSDAEARDYPALRLLEARALLALGKLDSALAALLREVPSVREYAEYRVTLATLLQQSGQSVEAARHWSALISVDDTRPAWWVGLAIALESRGEVSGAVKAYSQAAQLPGLSPSLTDYVRNRLKSLQAG